jgi:hypothetical protein
MKVYCVICSIDWEGDILMAIFSSNGKAENYVHNLGSFPANYDYKIEEWEVM